MILLGLGSNLSSSFGDRFKNIDLAIAHLEHYKIKIEKRSSFYETPSYPDKKNPKFINIVIQISTHLPAVDLASVLIFIETKLERERKQKRADEKAKIDLLKKQVELKKIELKEEKKHSTQEYL